MVMVTVLSVQLSGSAARPRRRRRDLGLTLPGPGARIICVRVTAAAIIADSEDSTIPMICRAGAARRGAAPPGEAAVARQ